MSRLRLAQVADPSNPPASTLEVYYDNAGTGFNTPVSLAAIDASGNLAHIAGFAVLDYRLIKVSILTGSGTWTPTNGCRAAYVECVGAGGQGGGAATSSTQVSVGGGGGGGAYAASWITGVSATVAYVCGAGGSGAAAGATGTVGADTTWGATVVVAKGGAGGGVMAAGTTLASQAGGAGGAAASCTGDLKVTGSIGDKGIRLSTTQGWSGDGGAAPYLGTVGANGVVSAVGTAGAAAVATAYGSGGSGAATLSTSAAGGAGAAGIIRVWEFA